MSLCLSQGHLDAWDYSLGRLEDETNFIIERENGRIVTEAQTMQLGMGGILAAKTGKAFTERLKSLSVHVKAITGVFD